MANFSDKLVRVPESVDRKIQRVCRKIQDKNTTKKTPRHQAIEVMADFYLMEAGK